MGKYMGNIKREDQTSSSAIILKNKKSPGVVYNSINNNSTNSSSLTKTTKRSSSETGVLEAKRDLNLKMSSNVGNLIESKKSSLDKRSFLSNPGVSPMKKTSSQSLLDKDKKVNYVCNTNDIQLKNKIENELQRLKYYSNSLNSRMKKK